MQIFALCSDVRLVIFVRTIISHSLGYAEIKKLCSLFLQGLIKTYQETFGICMIYRCLKNSKTIQNIYTKKSQVLYNRRKSQFSKYIFFKRPQNAFVKYWQPLKIHRQPLYTFVSCVLKFQNDTRRRPMVF